MRDEIWYREELIALRDLVSAALIGPNDLDRLALSALDHLHRKLSTAIEIAPSGRTPEASS